MKTKSRVLVAAMLLSALLPMAIQGAPLGTSWLTAAAVGQLPAPDSSAGGILGWSLFGGDSAAPNDPFADAQRGPMQNPPMNTAPPRMAPTAPPSQGGMPVAAARPAGIAPLGGVMPAGGVMQAGGVVHAGGDPNMRRSPAPSGDAQQPWGPLAAAGAAAPPSAGAQPGAARSGPPPRAACDALLVQARLRLSEGDWRTAANLAGQAKGMNVPYGVQDDSPAKVEALIGQHRELDHLAQQTQQSGGDVAAVRQRQGQLLLEQAEALLKWNQVDAAERATAQCRGPVPHVFAVRTQSARHARADRPGAPPLGRSAGDLPTDRPAAGGSHVGPERDSRPGPAAGPAV